MIIVKVRYYNVWFSLNFREEKDELKKQCLINMIETRKLLRMRTIYDWCQKQGIPVSMKFTYRRDYSLIANLWNLYSYLRFWLEISKSKPD